MDTHTQVKYYSSSIKERPTQRLHIKQNCVHRPFEVQAERTPNAVAVVFGDEYLTYQELNQKANQLAHYLQQYGVGPEVLVGICVERSLEMVVGLLGILKAGGAYVPLDPSYPPDRIAFMLDDAQVPVLVTQQHLLTRLPTHSIKVVCLDADAGMLAQQRKANVVSTVASHNLAYVIYTSGSTGRPKGVQIIHSGLLNLIYWHHDAFNVTASDRATQIASPAFDATGCELWPYLTIGASVHLLDEDTRIDPVKLVNWLIEHHITISFLPTALAEKAIAMKWPRTTALRFLLTGADVLHNYPPSTLPFALINNYGPTEATVVTTSGRILPDSQKDGPPSIGRPISNMEVYILDEQLHQVAIGTVGEVYIGGAGLARGYLHNPQLTEEKFISHPFDDEPGARLYKTGDLARYLPDGQIAFVGRIDHQIKIRGYRIEPDEIVAVLNRHPSIQASVVVAREDISDDKQLVAYIVLTPESSVTINSLRDILKSFVPEYMIPATFVVLEELPLTMNGKVDRDGLPIPNAQNTLQDCNIVMPGTPLEKQLAGIAASLLNRDIVGLDDNFFLLGGHSLLGTQVIARVSETFGVDLPLRTLFEAPTVRSLATKVEELIVALLETMSDEEALRLLPSIRS